MSSIPIGSLSLTTPIRLPNELLSHIVSQALLSPRLSSTTDELFIQPKCRMAFQSLCNGFGTSCRKYRAVLFREWFRVFHVQEIVDLEEIMDGMSSALKSVFVTGYIRELYFHQPLALSSSHFTFLTSLHTISYPLQCTRNNTGNSTSIEAFPVDRLQRLELREANDCSPDELRSINISSLICLTNLRITCGENGAWGPIPHYIPKITGARFSYQKMSRGESLAHLMDSYLAVLSPFKHLRTLSLDVHFTDSTVFPPDHSPLDAALALLGQAHLNPFQGFFNNNIPPPVPVPAAPAQPTTPTLPPCTGDNGCGPCWEARFQGTNRRELIAAKILARGLKLLETVEWTIWFRQRGTGEQRRRIQIDRRAGMKKPLDNSSLEATKCTSVEINNLSPIEGTKVNFAGLGDETEEGEVEEDALMNEASALDFVCRTIRVPFALYPAVLG